jgi:hypothetical protein
MRHYITLPQTTPAGACISANKSCSFLDLVLYHLPPHSRAKRAYSLRDLIIYHFPPHTKTKKLVTSAENRKYNSLLSFIYAIAKQLGLNMTSQQHGGFKSTHHFGFEAAAWY